jgi:hypothetical protein
VGTAALELDRTILAYAEGGANATGPFIDDGFNLSSDATPPFPSETSLNEQDPMLAEPADNGGFTRTIALNQGSPAIDFINEPGPTSVDQRGWLRDIQPDAGAFEINATRLPSLTIELNLDEATISWPANLPDSQLESTRSLTSPTWTPKSGAVEINGRWELTLPPNEAESYFRLSQ